MISLMEAAGRRPSVRRAGLAGSTPTNTIVGRPWICTCHVKCCPRRCYHAHTLAGAGTSSEHVLVA